MAERPARRAVLAALMAVAATGAAPAREVGRAAPVRDDGPVVAAAANLEFAVSEIAEAFARDTGRKVRLSLGSTGNLARQIGRGAPFELFLAADDATPLALHAKGLTRDEGVVYASGRLALIAPHGSPLDPEAGLEGLRAGLESGAVTRFAIANPEHAPFGIAAREALTSAGLWEAVQPVLVLGENVAQAAQFAVSGGAEGGIVAWSLALAPALRARGRGALIPETLHAPLRQRMALMPGAGPTAEAFHAYMQGPEARRILKRHGYELPGG